MLKTMGAIASSNRFGYSEISGPSTYVPSVIDTFEVEDGITMDSAMCVALSSNLVVVAYHTDDEGESPVLRIKTLSIDSSYNISAKDTLAADTITGSLAHEVGTFGLEKVDATHFVIAYTSGGNGILKMFSCDADGTSIAEVDTFQHDSDSGGHESLCLIDNNVGSLGIEGTMMLAYQKDSGAGHDGYARVVIWEDDFSFNESALYDAVEFSANISKWMHCVLWTNESGGADGTEHGRVLLAYHDTVSGLVFRWLTIGLDDNDVGWQITVSASTKITMWADGYRFPMMQKIDDSHFAVVTNTSTGVGHIWTWSIDENYDLEDVDQLGFQQASLYFCFEPKLSLIDSNHALSVFNGIRDGTPNTIASTAQVFSWDSGTGDDLARVDNDRPHGEFLSSSADDDLSSLDADPTKDKTFRHAVVKLDASHYFVLHEGADDDAFATTLLLS